LTPVLSVFLDVRRLPCWRAWWIFRSWWTANFLAADAAAGALIMKTREGHTWFSVNGHSGIGFQDNEGFYEFDLEIK
jgi:hypothetical protein